MEDCWHEYPGKRPDFLSLNDRHNHAINIAEDANLGCELEKRHVVDFMIDKVDDVGSGVINSDPEWSCLAQSVHRLENQIYDILPK